MSRRMWEDAARAFAVCFNGFRGMAIRQCWNFVWEWVVAFHLFHVHVSGLHVGIRIKESSCWRLKFPVLVLVAGALLSVRVLLLTTSDRSDKGIKTML
jgi:hypothetical protein